MILESISKLDERREYAFILKKDIVYDKIIENQKFLYQDSTINSNFVIEDANVLLADSPKQLSSIAKKINKKLSQNKKLKEVMQKNMAYL